MSGDVGAVTSFAAITVKDQAGKLWMMRFRLLEPPAPLTPDQGEFHSGRPIDIIIHFPNGSAWHGPAGGENV